MSILRWVKAADFLCPPSRERILLLESNFRGIGESQKADIITRTHLSDV